MECRGMIRIMIDCEKDGLFLASNKNHISGRFSHLVDQRPVIQVMTTWLSARVQGVSRPKEEPPARGRGLLAQEVREVTE